MAGTTLTVRDTVSPFVNRLLDSVESLDPDRLEDLWNAIGRGDEPVEDLVVQSGLIDETQLAEGYANHYLLPLFDPPDDAPPPIDLKVAEVLPAEFCRQHTIAPLNVEGGCLEVAVCLPDSLRLADEVRDCTGRAMRPLFAARSVVERLIELLYPATETETTTLPPPATPKLARPQLPPPQQWHDGDASGDQGRDAPRAREAAVAEAGKTQVDVPAAAANPGQPRREPEVELKRLLGEAIKAGATELHFEPLPGTGGRLRWRVDGELGEPTFLSTETYGALLDRLKSLAGIDAATQRPVCSGAFDLRQSGRRLRVRLHCCQSSCGETLLARLVDPSELPPRLSEVGFDRRQREAIEASLHGDGLILVTGPSGQGQRTTLYSCFDLLDPDAKSLWTVEDSAAYRLAGVTQIETAREPLMSGAQAVDAFRRQAADALLLGSLADATSASHCVAAAMAGRLVLCGVAAEDAVSAIGTVRQLGVPDALLGNRLRLIIVQRCLRRLCDRCKVPDWLDEETRRRWNLPAERSVRAPRGCDHCDQTGYRGRVPVFDVVPVTAESQRLIGSGASADPLRSSLAGDATSFLFEQALQRLCEGATSLDEILTLPQVRTTSDASKMLT